MRAVLKKKRCSNCKQTKSAAHFSRLRKARDGLMVYCKTCVSIRKKTDYARDPERIKKRVNTYRIENAEKVNTQRKVRRDARKEIINAQRREFIAANPAHRREYNAQWYQENREAQLAYSREYGRAKPEVRRAANRRYTKRTPIKIVLV